MENQVSSIKSRTPLFFYWAFGFLLLAVIGLAVVVLNIYAAVRTQQEIVLTVSPELNSQIINEFQKSAVSINEKIIDFIQQIGRTDHDAAEKAIALAQQAKTEGNEPLAMIYALNAINHEASNTAYLGFYNDLILKKNDVAIADIDQFVSILDVAVFRINATDVPAMIEMKKTLLEKRENLIAAISQAKAQEEAEQIAANLKDVRDGHLSIEKITGNGEINEKLLQERLEMLTGLLADTSLTQDDIVWLKEELQYATGLYSIATTIAAAKNTIAKANSIVRDIFASRREMNDADIVIARNQLQTGSTLLAQIWSADCTQYQEFVNKAQGLQAEIAACDKKINVLASTPAKEKIRKIISECRNIAQGYYPTYTSQINLISAKAKEIPQLLASISDPDTQNALKKDFDDLNLMMTNLVKARYKAYQNWAVEKLIAARKAYKAEAIVSDADANRMFDEFIIEIDPSLLLPDVNALYNSIYNLIYNQLPDKAQKQYEKATSPKVKKLEDF